MRRGRRLCDPVLATVCCAALALGVLLSPVGPAQAESPPWAEEGAVWESAALVEHPLVGRIWDARARRFVSPQEMVAALRDKRIILLGEKHNNLDHHLGQAWLLRALAGPEDRAVFEMIPERLEAALADAWPDAPLNADGLGAVLEWEQRGWYGWNTYRPLFEALADRRAIPAAGNPNNEDNRLLARGGLQALDEQAQTRLLATGLFDPLETALAEALNAEVIAGHCNMLPPEAAPGIALIQRYRDAVLAANLALAERAAPGRAFLIAGAGHTRLDRGAPWYLRRMGYAPGKIAAVAWREVTETMSEDILVQDEALAAITDFIWFTPRVDTVDPCVKFREQLKAMGRG